ncbi:hypothetical protein WJX79_006793 [Trebouxia sp. C0005]
MVCKRLYVDMDAVFSPDTTAGTKVPKLDIEESQSSLPARGSAEELPAFWVTRGGYPTNSGVQHTAAGV